jgi:hypothetical protein
MTRSPIALALALTLTSQSLAKDTPVPVVYQVSRLRQGSFIEIRYLDGKKERGYLVATASDGIDVQKNDRRNAPPHRVAFAEVKSVRAVEPSHTPPAAWIAAGVIVGVVVAAVIVYAIFRHNE